MSDAAVPVPPSRLEQSYDAAVSMQAEQARTWRKLARRKHWRDNLQLSIIVILAAGYLWLLPSQHYITVFSYLNPAGVHDTSTALSALPPNQRVAGIESLLWQYVRLREHYSPSEASNDYAIVSAMSAIPTVQEQYQRWANPKLNDKAPAVLLGPGGYIRVSRVGSAFLEHSPDYATGIYQIRFCRLVVPNGQPAYAQRWVVTERYQLAETIPLWERVSFNHAGLIVTEYPGPETEGAIRTNINPGGGENLCDR